MWCRNFSGAGTLLSLLCWIYRSLFPPLPASGAESADVPICCAIDSRRNDRTMLPREKSDPVISRSGNLSTVGRHKAHMAQETKNPGISLRYAGGSLLDHKSQGCDLELLLGEQAPALMEHEILVAVAQLIVGNAARNRHWPSANERCRSGN